jgi:hypothetical protein
MIKHALGWFMKMLVQLSQSAAGGQCSCSKLVPLPSVHHCCHYVLLQPHNHISSSIKLKNTMLSGPPQALHLA